jgi:hypothetical protein
MLSIRSCSQYTEVFCTRIAQKDVQKNCTKQIDSCRTLTLISVDAHDFELTCSSITVLLLQEVFLLIWKQKTKGFYFFSRCPHLME